ncbi:hypothetical protein AB4Y36_03545 [Paraburkholderia sp. BR10936]|uniref:hypothetical protein n=1 Tax=Paraburkholderia sp. BR10936 TaxID=3236993 RepID=UPI0034D31F7D
MKKRQREEHTVEHLGEIGAIEGAEALTIGEFLETMPPNEGRIVSDLVVNQYLESQQGFANVFNRAEIELHCPGDDCNGIRVFRCDDDPVGLSSERERFFFARYRCSNCRKHAKVFSILARLNQGSTEGRALKVGEEPPFGPPTPPRLLKLVGPDCELFLKGRRCENQGLGVGAFVYYRRVIEDQKSRILKEIVKVAERLGVKKEQVDLLRRAAEEYRFSEAMAMAKSALPERLMIDGHNPLSLLHSALSKGVHELTDEQCLEIAASVRVVLAELSERIAQALKDEAELKTALSHLMHLGKGAAS